MQLKPPRRPRRSAAHAPATPKPRPAESDDPWAGEDVDWQAEAERRGDDPDAFARFIRAVAVAAGIGVLFWLGVVLLVLWLL